MSAETLSAPSATQPASESNGHVPSASVIHISPRVVFALALNAALSTYGVVGLASRYTGFECTHTEPRRGLEVHLTEDSSTGATHVAVEIHIIVEYGVRIQSVTSSLQHQVSYGIERSTGYTVDTVSVHVSGLRVTNAD